jgi:hypothetical protein
MTALALALLLAAPQAAASPQAASKTTPMSVAVEADAKGGPEVETWARELRSALEARKEEFRPARGGEKPELVVRLESVGKAADGTALLNGALVLGTSRRPFNYGFKDVKAQAEVLARNMRKLADQMKAGPSAR